jgi:5S rRNA maturation endonuclease (ribonuclease M5)
MKMKTAKQYRSTDQKKLKVLCDLACDNIEELFDYFDLDYRDKGKMMSMACPIHDGDNDTALNLYHVGDDDYDNYRGNWKCRTHGCEKCFKSSIIGFVRGVLSHRKYGWVAKGDKMATFSEAVSFIEKFVHKDLKDVKISTINREKSKFTNAISHIREEAKPETPKVSRQQVRSLLNYPAQYFIDRGYSEKILDRYDVGLCTIAGKPMNNRVVAPIYNLDCDNMVGCTGRSIFEECPKCGAYHDPNKDCPDSEYRWAYSKWKHSADFKSQNNLYNYWKGFAKEHIAESHVAIIVESPGNVWRLEENGIHNSVAIFGCNLSDRQKMILDSSGAMAIIVLTDNDEAGRQAAQDIKKKCQNTYRVFIPEISKGDIGEMTSEEIDKEIKQYIKDVI